MAQPKFSHAQCHKVTNTSLKLSIYKRKLCELKTIAENAKHCSWIQAHDPQFNSQLHYQLGYKPLALMTVDCRQLHLCRLHTCVNE